MHSCVQLSAEDLYHDHVYRSVPDRLRDPRVPLQRREEEGRMRRLNVPGQLRLERWSPDMRRWTFLHSHKTDVSCIV